MSPRTASSPARKTIKLGSISVPVPKSQVLRVALGIAFCFGGFLGFLPVLGFWMLPVGMLILSVDFPVVRRVRRRMEVWLVPYLRRVWLRVQDWWNNIRR